MAQTLPQPTHGVVPNLSDVPGIPSVPSAPSVDWQTQPLEVCRWIQRRMPEGGLFSGQQWRVSPKPFALESAHVQSLELLGRILVRFYQASNLLYRLSVAGKEPAWVARWLDQGKPDSLIQLQRSKPFQNAIPRVLRPDILLTDSGLTITELDSVPGGIGVTAWLNQTYQELVSVTGQEVIGGGRGMMDGFASIFGEAPRVVILVSEEAAAYRPEMIWLAKQIGNDRFIVRDATFQDWKPGDAVYRFFELFDLANIPVSQSLFEAAQAREITLTPPPKPLFEEKMLLALLWNRNLHDFWKRELGTGFFDRLLQYVPYSWVMDPAPLPPQGAIPGLNLTDWHQLAQLSKRERELIIKISGFSEKAWGARGVCYGADRSSGEWAAAVEEALMSFNRNPYVLQRYHKPALFPFSWYRKEGEQIVAEEGRVRLCPYYFVTGEGDMARASWNGALATICPADKKIIHGMSDAVLLPCSKEVTSD